MNSAKEVEINDDLLTEILINLPPKSLFKLMIVSKRWKNLITDPFFIRIHNQQQQRRSSTTATTCGRVLALFQRTVTGDPRPPSQPPMNMLRLLPPPALGGNHHLGIKYDVPWRFGYFINSSNGMILCGRHSSTAPTYFVINPVTARWVSLPSPRNKYKWSTIGILCYDDFTITSRELKPNFIVVRAAAWTDGKSMHMETYSTRTGEWVGSTLVATREFVLCDEPPVVANGVFHWRTPKDIAVYDTKNNKDHGKNLLRVIEMPCFLEHTVSITFTRSTSEDDMLWYGMLNPQRMEIYQLPNDGEKWELIYNITIDSMGVFIPCPVPMGPNWRNTITLEGFIHPLIVVLRQRERIYFYNLESNSIELVRYSGRPIIQQSIQCDYICPYVESLSLSSYFL